MSEKKLNQEQKKAVEHLAGPMLVVAGAGTGKTTVLIERLKFLIKNRKAEGDEVLLLTFTEKGAGEMEERALEILPYGFFDLWISTFHSFCERILREHALDIGLSSDFRIVSTTEQWILVKKNLDLFDLDYYQPLGNPNKFIFELVKHFSRLKDEYISTREYLDFVDNKIEDKDISLGGIDSKQIKNDDEKGEILRYRELANAYNTYNKILLDNGLLDFGDLVNYCLKLFETRPVILEKYREQFKYIMIDEFQDTNLSQYMLIKLLASPKNNLLVVGDDDQSIYKFRGASLSNIMEFKDDFPKAREVVLNNNYRSGQNILDLAYKFIQHNNPNRLEERIKIDKKLNSPLSISDEIRHYQFDSIFNEQSWVAEKISALKKNDPGLKWSDFAILVRSNAIAQEYLEELKRKNIPATFVSLRGLYYKPIILDSIAYLKLLDDYHESSSLFRVLNIDVFRIDHKDLIEISRFSRRKNWSMYETLKNIEVVTKIDSSTQEKIKFLMTLIEKHSQLVKEESPSKVFYSFVHDAGLDKKDYDEFLEYYSYLNQFYEKIKKFEAQVPGARLKDFMELLDMELDSGETGSLRLDFGDSETVNIMTVHASKGLEFKNVFLVNLVDKKFPTINRQDKIQIPLELLKEEVPDSKNAHIEEERRLFYVALTRAKEKLFLCSAKDCGGVREKRVSVFVEESDIVSESLESASQDKNMLLRDIERSSSVVPTKKIEYSLPTKFSFSQIEAYSNCPLQYKFNFLIKIPVPSKSVFVFGRLMHNVLREMMSMLISTGQMGMFGDKRTSKVVPSLKDFQTSFKKYWMDEGYASKEEAGKYKKQGQDMIRSLHAYYESAKWPDVLFCEKSFTCKISNYFFKGSIDRVDRLEDGTLEIVDYKTGTAKKSLSYKEKRQLILYKIALEEGLGERVSKQSFIYLENTSIQSFVSTEKEEEKLKQEIIATIEEMKKGDFSAKPGFLCDYCDFNNICEFRKKN
ncbi:hypothetical protein C0583_05245 [Candidatus Parcubacteria bacterium]|nr:MAG: hypothetical protein C0583_05245 [Candidatus Parcubacteria bacterium]